MIAPVDDVYDPQTGGLMAQTNEQTTPLTGILGYYLSSCEKVNGFAIDQNNLQSHLDVSLFIDNQFVETVKADRLNDYQRNWGVYGDGNGFEFVVPAKYSDGQNHYVQVFYGSYALNAANSPSINCAAPAAPTTTTVIVTAANTDPQNTDTTQTATTQTSDTTQQTTTDGDDDLLFGYPKNTVLLVGGAAAVAAFFIFSGD